MRKMDYEQMRQLCIRYANADPDTEDKLSLLLSYLLYGKHQMRVNESILADILLSAVLLIEEYRSKEDWPSFEESLKAKMAFELVQETTATEKQLAEFRRYVEKIKKDMNL